MAPDMQANRILYAKHGAVARITINRPEVMNALDIESRRELLSLLDQAEGDKEVKVVVLTGAGDKAFCAGADLRIFLDMSSTEARKYVRLAKRVARRIETLSKPVIAAVNGYALGGGLELILACDLVVASDEAKFGQTELNVGAIPGVGGTQRLPRAVGVRTAKELLFTARLMDAAEAKELRLVNRVVPKGKLSEAVQELIDQIVLKSPLMLELAKKAVNMSLQTDLAAGLEYESELFAYCFSTEDQKEGVRAFLEKRSPQFRGK